MTTKPSDTSPTHTASGMPLAPGSLSPTEYFKSLKDKDQDLYDQWAKTGSKKHMGELVDSLGKLIYSEVRRASGTLPPSALSAEAKKWAIKGIQTYDPSKGAGISTHVVNWLQKVRRLNYTYQNAARLPENLHLKHSEYSHAVAELTEELNREPTDVELSAKLGWSKPQTVKFKNMLYSDLVESASEKANETSRFNEDAIIMEHIRSQLDYQEQFILDNVNVKALSATDIAKSLGVNINRYNYLKAKLIEKIKKIKMEAGAY